MFATDVSMGVTELAVAAEERGFDSVWIPEHTHIPTSRLTPPPTGDEELAEEYRRSVDPLVALAAAATATSRIHLGTGVLLPAQRDPIVTAKALATLQNISGGRLELGIGFGWNRDEIEQHGVEFARRREVAREHVLAMRALWTQDEASFRGDFVRLEPSWSWPKPEVPIPVLLGGGSGPKLMAQLVEYGDGWIPIGGSGLAEAIPRYRARLEEAGRDPAQARIVPFGSHPSAEKIEHFASIGVTECVFRLPSAPAGQVLAVLDDQAELIGRIP
ncbi:MAG: LLM class F420-dependent oxidoreductase [Microthrixaceae bacterium]